MTTLTMHVRCPVKECGQTLDIQQSESWGEVDPTDHGRITITVSGHRVRQHMATHNYEAIEAAQAARRKAYGGEPDKTAAE